METEKPTITVEHGLPIPVYNNAYPWNSMGVGDSFFVAGKKPSGMSGVKRYQTDRYGFKYTCRTVMEGGVKGTRVWRTE